MAALRACRNPLPRSGDNFAEQKARVRTLEERLKASEQDLKAKEAALAKEGDGRLASLQESLTAEQEKSLLLQRAHEDVVVDKSKLEDQLHASASSVETLQTQLSTANDELSALRLAQFDIMERAAQAEQKLEGETASLKTLEACLAEAAQDFKEREAGLAKEGDAHIASLQEVLTTEQEKLSSLQRAHEDLSAHKSELEDQLRESASSVEALQTQLSTSHTELGVLRLAQNEITECAARAGEKLLEETSRAQTLETRLA